MYSCELMLPLLPKQDFYHSITLWHASIEI